METYRTEEEQVQAIKDWWKENARAVVLGLVIGVAIIAGYRYWSANQSSQAAAASDVYVQIVLAQQAGDTQKTEGLMATLQKEYAGTTYSTLASLVVATDAVNANDNAKAATLLRWAMEHSASDELEHIARNRLARVLLSMQKNDEALALVKDVKAEGFDSMYAEVRGDIYLAMNDTESARTQYRNAMDKSTAGDQRAKLIQMKLDNLAAQNTENNNQ